MAEFVVRLADLLPPFRTELEAARTAAGWDSGRLQAAINRAFGFLGAFTSARVEAGTGPEGDDVLHLEFTAPPGRDFATADKRFRKATRAAENGSARTALPALLDLAKEYPEVAKFHRAIGQAYLVLGDFESAEDAMLRSLSLDPLDADALTLLGNLYAKRDRPTDAIPLYKRSIALTRNVYALNNLGAAYAEIGDTERALATLKEASTVDPDYPNTWFGIGLTLSRLERLDVLPEAIRALDVCLEVTRERRAAPEVWDGARGLLDGLTRIQAREDVAAAQEAVGRTLASAATDGEQEVRIEEQSLRGVLAKLELAWIHERSHHRVVVTPTGGPEREHHLLHELQHLLLIQSARAARTNRWFASTAATREKALRSMASEVTRIEKLGLPAEAISQLTIGALDGLLGQLFNFPIDFLIETRLQATYPGLRELFYQSLKGQLDTAASIANNERLKLATPRQVFRANCAMNGAMALWFEDRYPRRTDLVAQFEKTEAWTAARRLYTTWTADAKEWTPGREYAWIDNWAEVLGLRDWYIWKDGNAATDSTGQNAIDRVRPRSTSGVDDDDTSVSVEASGPLDAKAATAAMRYMLRAIDWTDQVPHQTVAQVAALAAVTGQRGINYLDANSRYDLPGYSEAPVSGLELLSVMYALIKTLDPSLDQGIDLERPYAVARTVYERKKRDYR